MYICIHVYMYICIYVYICICICICQRGENRASVLAVFENTHISSRTCTSHVTPLGWGVGDVNGHVNLRHMHISRYVTGLEGGGDVNVHVNLRHMHISRYVTGLDGGGDVKVHVNLRHMHI